MALKAWAKGGPKKSKAAFAPAGSGDRHAELYKKAASSAMSAHKAGDYEKAIQHHEAAAVHAEKAGMTDQAKHHTEAASMQKENTKRFGPADKVEKKAQGDYQAKPTKISARESAKGGGPSSPERLEGIKQRATESKAISDKIRSEQAAHEKANPQPRMPTSAKEATKGLIAYERGGRMSITGGGLEPAKHADLKVGDTHHMGASSSPEKVTITHVGDDHVKMKHGDGRESTHPKWIAQDLIARGNATAEKRDAERGPQIASIKAHAASERASRSENTGENKKMHEAHKEAEGAHREAAKAFPEGSAQSKAHLEKADRHARNIAAIKGDMGSKKVTTTDPRPGMTEKQGKYLLALNKAAMHDKGAERHHGAGEHDKGLKHNEHGAAAHREAAKHAPSERQKMMHEAAATAHEHESKQHADKAKGSDKSKGGGGGDDYKRDEQGRFSS